ncbi:vWA domain-containing protein [Bernardetia sp.]|uniref:vWA domain-containing protein n=1 Tax=Bernardetia sp. TaxID=1937974 RepID=UPI0025C24386|nr:vWA domain-containing protein [Bernardetia sp.]
MISVKPTDEPIKLKVLMVIDSSRSMFFEDDTNNPVDRYKNVEEAIEKLTVNLNSLSKIDWYISLLLFKVDSQFVLGDGIWSNKTEDIKRGLKKHTKLVNEGTAIWDTLYKAVNVIEKEKIGYRVIVCLTDGEDNRDSTGEKFQLVKRKVEEVSIPIYTVGYGLKSNLLKEIAVASRYEGGTSKYYGGTDIEGIKKMFNELPKLASHAYNIKFNRKKKDSKIEIMVKLYDIYEKEYFKDKFEVPIKEIS